MLTLSLFYGCSSSKTVDNRIKVEKTLSEWILLNADFPDSYISDSFSNFTEVDFSLSSDTPERYYRITHSYKLKSKGNKEMENKHFFVLNKDFKVAIISNNETTMLQSVPPSIFEWAITFGENFKNIDYGGLDTSYYFRKFHDYKNIGGIIWRDFLYLDDDCFQLLLKALKSYPNEGMQIKRIINAVPEFETGFDKFGNGLNELGMDLYKTYGKNPQINFAVIQVNNDTSEIFTVTYFDETKHELHFKEINRNNIFSYSLDTSYLNTNCFKYILKYGK
jgi:hypothetical protein